MLTVALTVLLELLTQQPDISRAERTERDTSPCTLENGELAATLVDLVRRQGTPEPELRAVHEAIGKAVREHQRGHGWPDSLEQRVPPSSCPAEALHQLTDVGVQLAAIGRRHECEWIAEILERSGSPASAIGLLSSIPSVPDDITCPPGPMFPGWELRRFNPCEERLASIERRQGHWQSALDHYTAWPAVSSCGNGGEELSWRREMNRLECLAALGRWEEYGEICRAQLCGRGWVFATHFIESYRAQGMLERAAGDLELTLQSSVPLTRSARLHLQTEQIERIENEHEDRCRKARERARVQLRFLEQEESGDLGELPELLRSGLPFDVALEGLRRLGARGVAQVITLASDAFHDPEVLGRLLQLLALTGDEQAQAFLTAGDVQARVDPNILPYLLEWWDLARQGVDVRRTICKGLYLPE